MGRVHLNNNVPDDDIPVFHIHIFFLLFNIYVYVRVYIYLRVCVCVCVCVNVVVFVRLSWFSIKIRVYKNKTNECGGVTDIRMFVCFVLYILFI
jgi:hypothetical protein